ncbi:MAG: arylsulfatase A [Rhodothermales bacterium]|jgi:arylsulfatase A
MLDRRTFLRQILAAGAVSALPGGLACQSAAAKRPNFMVFLADDLGFGDLRSYGNRIIQTPRLDAFASQGMRFTDFHSGGTVCSPSRAALLTGRNPYRSGFYYIAGSGMHLQQGEVTIASLLRESGYDTCFVGKWHLSRFDRTNAVAPTPGDHGFDHWFATAVNAFEGPENPQKFYRNGEAVGEVSGWYCDVIVQEALDWLQNRPNPERPFFLEVCSHEPHTPVEPPESFAARYANPAVDSLEESALYGQVVRPPGIDGNKRYYYGTVEQLDRAFGNLMDGMDAAGLTDETLSIFTSDNGPESPVNFEESRGEWTDPLRDRSFGTPGIWRGMKRYPYEGGHRVPGIARWPGRVQAGTVSDALINGTDFLPTLAELAGVPIPTDRAIDGISFVPALNGRPLHRDRPVFWFFPAHEDTYYLMPHVAMRSAGWTLLGWLNPKDPDALIMDWLKEESLGRFALYDLDSDPEQRNDLLLAQPERAEVMIGEMRAFWAEIQLDSPRWEEWRMK